MDCGALLVALKRNNPGCNCCACTNCNQGALYGTYTTISGSVSGAPVSVTARAQVTNACNTFREWVGFCQQDTNANMTYANYPPIPVGSFQLTGLVSDLNRSCTGAASGIRSVNWGVGLNVELSQACTEGVLSYGYSLLLSYTLQGPAASIPWHDPLVPPDNSGLWTGGDPDPVPRGRHWWHNSNFVPPGDQETILFRERSNPSDIAGLQAGFSYTVWARYRRFGLASPSDIPSSFTLNPLYNLLGITATVTLS